MALKYKAGDQVRIKSLDWYNKNKDNYGAIYAGNGFCFWKNMVRHCGEIMKITSVKVDPEDSNKGFYFMENSDERWTDGMIEGLVEEKTLIERFDDNGLPFNEWLSHKGAFYIPDGYELKDENGNVVNTHKIVLEKKKNEYPKTLEECCEVLDTGGYQIDYFVKPGEVYEYEKALITKISAFYNLIICRDAYWKLYGEEMELNGPWEPDWNTSEPKYVIAYTSNGIEKQWENTYCKGFAFPTEKMRDAFYKNFKELIEQCKELL